MSNSHNNDDANPRHINNNSINNTNIDIDNDSRERFIISVGTLCR